MGIVIVYMFFFVGTASGRYVNLTAYNSLYPCFFCLFIKIHGAVHNAVVGNGNSGLIVLFYSIKKPAYTATAV